MSLEPRAYPTIDLCLSVSPSKAGVVRTVLTTGIAGRVRWRMSRPCNGAHTGRERMSSGWRAVARVLGLGTHQRTRH